MRHTTTRPLASDLREGQGHHTFTISGFDMYYYDHHDSWLSLLHVLTDEGPPRYLHVGGTSHQLQTPAGNDKNARIQSHAFLAAGKPNTRGRSFVRPDMVVADVVYVVHHEYCSNVHKYKYGEL